MIWAVLTAFVYPAFDAGLTNLGEWVTENSVLGGFVYGTANRLLIPLGLHHILNNFPWFQLGSYQPPDGGEPLSMETSRASSKVIRPPVRS